MNSKYIISNIFKPEDRKKDRIEKEIFLNQKAKVIWLTGLSGSGKSSIAINLKRKLKEKGFFIYVLDGDEVRNGINNNLSFSEIDRKENIRRIAEVSKLFVGNGIITINCFISPTEEIRKMSRKIIGDDYIEVFINAPLDVCEKRYPKGLDQKAREGEIKNFTGIDSPYDEPENPDLVLYTDKYNVMECANQLEEFILPLIR